jgi:hypothetical protein
MLIQVGLVCDLQLIEDKSSCSHGICYFRTEDIDLNSLREQLVQLHLSQNDYKPVSCLMISNESMTIVAMPYFLACLLFVRFKTFDWLSIPLDIVDAQRSDYVRSIIAIVNRLI